MKKNVLLVGSGGREHALFKALKRSKRELDIYAFPGNVGMTMDGAKKIDEKINGWNELADWAQKNSVDLTVVGPEIPLVEGIVDKFVEKNLVIFGPSKFAAQLEGSKKFSKELMKKYDIPTAKYESFTDKKSAENYINKVGAPIVVKYSGLAAGKGVSVCETVEQAKKALDDIFDDGIFGTDCVVIEEMMFGEEASIFVLTDGTNYKILPSAQDHKRIFDNDQGPNTGGMGAYSPAPVADKKLIEEVEKTIIIPTLEAMKKEGSAELFGGEYRGLLYVGIMATENATGGLPTAKVVEFNCRFGDPETEAVLPLVNCDWFDVFYASAVGDVSKIEWNVSENFAATIVLASRGYPETSQKGVKISGLEEAQKIDNVDIYHAGTAINENGELITNGGRVLAITAWDETLKKAIDKAYSAVGKISFDGMQYRKDIAKKGLVRLGEKA
ncbi:MAG: phosphoribosylamine--glycine ligase [Chitinivibrionia bacterium]|nr:phosphoribosylamine--glycine ligase [Chitinivibrionia bacterium]